MGKVARLLRSLAAEYALSHALAVTKIDENHPTLVAGRIDPTDELDSLADVGFAEFVAMMSAHFRKLRGSTADGRDERRWKR